MKKRAIRLLVAIVMLLSCLPIVAEAAKNLGYKFPVPGGTITQYYSNGHQAIDIGSPVGTPIYATKPGTIVSKYTGCNNYNRQYGTCKSGGVCTPNADKNYISNVYCNYGFGWGFIIKHTDGTWSEYAHMNSLANLTVGSTVEQGTYLGGLGSSGNSSGPHLHFAIRTGNVSNYWNATPLNPMSYMDLDDNGTSSPADPEASKTPGKPAFENIKSMYNIRDNITFVWSSTKNTTHYNIYITKFDGLAYKYYENIFYAESGLIKNLPEGNYRIILQSTNSNYWEDDGSNWLYTDGDPMYITVFDKPEKPVLKDMKDIYNKRDNIILSWETSKTATHYNIYVDTLTNGKYIRSKTIHYAENGITESFEPGEYRVVLQSTNYNYWDNSNWLYTDGDWVYFTVFDKPDKPEFTSLKKSYNPGEEVVLSWEISKTATHYNIYVDTLTNGEYKRSKTIHYAENGMTELFEPGTYRVVLQSTNYNYWDGSNWLYTDGDWMYFTVCEKDVPYTSSTIKKTGNVLTIHTDLYNFAVPYDIIIAGYKENKFVAIKRIPHNEQSSSYILEGNIDEVKIMVLDSLSELKPLCETEVIPSTEFIIE